MLMNRRKLLKKLSDGSFNNVSFTDARNLLEGFGFHLSRINGSHHVFTNVGIQEQINFQDVNGEAKPYQLRQLIRLVERYNLNLEDEL